MVTGGTFTAAGDGGTGQTITIGSDTLTLVGGRNITTTGLATDNVLLDLNNTVYVGQLTATTTMGAATSTPWGTLSVEQIAGSTLNKLKPMFVINSQGTSTPLLFVTQKGIVALGSTTPGANLLKGSLVVGSSTDSSGHNEHPDVYFAGGLGIGSATSTDGLLETSGIAYIGNIIKVKGAGTSTIAGGLFANDMKINLQSCANELETDASGAIVCGAQDTTGDWTGTIDGNNFAGGAIGAGELIYGGSAGSFSELAAGTKGQVLMFGTGGLPTWQATSTLVWEGDTATSTITNAGLAVGGGGLKSSSGLTLSDGILLLESGVTGTSTFASSGLAVGTGGLASSDGLTLTGGVINARDITGTSTFGGGITIAAGGLNFALPSCSGSGALSTNADGGVICSNITSITNPNLIYRTLSATKYYTASSSATDNLAWHFANGFVASASSSIAGPLFVSGALNATSTLHVSGNAWLGANLFAGGTTSQPLAAVAFGPATDAGTADVYVSGGLGVGNATTSDGGFQVGSLLSFSPGSNAGRGRLRFGGGSGFDGDIFIGDLGQMAIGTAISGGSLSFLEFNTSDILAGYVFRAPDLVGSGAYFSITPVDTANDYTVLGTNSLTTSNDLVLVDTGYIGMGSTTPWGQLSVDQIANQGRLKPLFVVGDNGTSTPFLFVTQKGVIGFGTSSPTNLFLNPGDVAIGRNGATADLFVSGGLGVGNATTADGVLETSGIAHIGGLLHVRGNATSTFSDSIQTNKNIFMGGGSTEGPHIIMEGGLNSNEMSPHIFLRESAGPIGGEIVYFTGDNTFQIGFRDVFSAFQPKIVMEGIAAGWMGLGGTTSPALLGVGDISIGQKTSGDTSDLFVSGGLGVGNATTVDNHFVVGTDYDFVVYGNTGRVGIGTSSPAGGLVDVGIGGNGTTKDLYVSGALGVGQATTADGWMEVNRGIWIQEKSGSYDNAQNSLLVVASTTMGSNTAGGDAAVTLLRVGAPISGGAVYGTALGVNVDCGNTSCGMFVIQENGAQLLKVLGTGALTIDLPGTGTGNALCHTDAAGTGDQEVVDCTSTPSADYAEMYPTEKNLAPGDIVALGDALVQTAEGDNISRLKKSDVPYQDSIIGIVSDPSKATDFNVIGYNISDEDNPMPVTLKGRVPVVVSNENGAIRTGDKITSSSLAGVGMRATREGPTVGIALSSFDGMTGTTTTQEIYNEQTGITEIKNITVNKIMIFVDLGWNHLDAGASILAGAASDTFNGSLTVDQLSGRITNGSSLNLAGGGIYNVSEIVSALGNWSLSEDGTLHIKRVEAESVVAKEYGILQTAHAYENTIGEGRILRGEKEAIIYSNKITPDAKVFVSFTSDLEGRSWHIKEKINGSEFVTPDGGTAFGYFRIVVSSASPNDLAFDWWIVGTEITDDQLPVTNNQTNSNSKNSGNQNEPPVTEPVTADPLQDELSPPPVEEMGPNDIIDASETGTTTPPTTLEGSGTPNENVGAENIEAEEPPAGEPSAATEETFIEALSLPAENSLPEESPISAETASTTPQPAI